MNLSREYLERCAADSGYQLAPLEKVIRLGEFAANAGRHPLLRDTLALKGGTALNLCFGAPKRLSVDLDFNYIGHVDRGKMLESRPSVEEAIAGLSARLGYKAQKSAEAFAGRKFFLHYQSVLGQPDRIEVDVNYLFRAPIAGTERREIWQPGELDRPTALLVSLEEILIGKLLAFFDRCAPRDLWDLARLSEPAVEAMKSELFRPRFIAFSAILDHPLSTYGRGRLEGLVTDRTVAEQLAPMLIASEKPQRTALLNDAWAVVERYLTPEPGEEAYLAAIGRGELVLEALFSDVPEEAHRLSGHPAILWKLSNVRGYLAKKGKKSSPA